MSCLLETPNFVERFRAGAAVNAAERIVKQDRRGQWQLKPAKTRRKAPIPHTSGWRLAGNVRCLIEFRVVRVSPDEKCEAVRRISKTAGTNPQSVGCPVKYVESVTSLLPRCPHVTQSIYERLTEHHAVSRFRMDPATRAVLLWNLRAPARLLRRNEIVLIGKFGST